MATLGGHFYTRCWGAAGCASNSLSADKLEPQDTANDQ